MKRNIAGELDALWKKVLWLENQRITTLGGGVPTALHASEHSDGGDDEIDILDLGGYSGNASDVLLGNKTWGAGGGLSDGDKGDITVTSSGAVWTIDNDVVSNAKLANMAQATIKGRADGAGTGDPTDLTADQVSTILDGATDPFIRTSEGGGGSPSGGSTGDLLDWQFIRKTGDETVSTSTALQDDNELLFAIAANESWEFEIVLNYSGSEGSDIKVSVTGPTGCAGQWSPLGPHEGTSSVTRSYNSRGFNTWNASESHVFGCISTLRTSAVIKGIARNGGTGGNITLQWAQGTSSSSTLVLTDSYIVARRVA